MLIFCRKDLSGAERKAILEEARRAGFLAQEVGSHRISLFGEGDVSPLLAMPGVERVAPRPEKAGLAEREEGAAPRTSPVTAGGISVGEGFVVIAGPCAVEGRSRLLELAHAVKEAGADLLRGGAYKPRTSPYSFRGLGREGLEMLAQAREETGLPVVTEALETRDVALVAEFTDVLQIGTRNMMSYPLLTEAGRCGKPVLLKRGMCATLTEWLWAAEYLLVEGAPGVILCERGIRTFSSSLRNTLDLSAVPAMQERTDLPVIVDPSHGTGWAPMVPAMARAAAAAGAHGVMLEIHDDPDRALSDGKQAVLPVDLEGLVRTVREIAALVRVADETREA